MRSNKLLARLTFAFVNIMFTASAMYGAADLSITKAVNNLTPNVGDVVTYTIVGKNNGSDTTRISITDTLPAGLTWLGDSENKSQFDCTNIGNVVTCTGTQNFSPNETVLITIAARVASEGNITNTANIVSIQGVADSNNANNSASASLTAYSYANLALTNTDSADPVVTNSTLVYTLGVSNGGPNTATSLILTDTLPAGVVYQSAIGTGWSCSQAAGVVTCTNPTLANAASSNVSITVTAPATAGTITNTATVVSGVTDPTPANNTNITQATTVNPPNADVALIKTAPSSATINNTIEYKLSVRNNGPSTTNNITVTDILPASVTYQTSYGTNWICTYTAGTRTVSCVHPTDLLNGSSTDDNITIIVVGPSTAQTVTNTASVTSSIPDYTSANNTSSASTTVSATSFSSSNPRSFTLQKQYNINGNMKIIGNSMLLKSDGTCAALDKDNNDISTIWANRDTDTTTWNATSADLILPRGVDSSKIKYAALYWQGRVDSDNDDATFWANAKTIKFKAPGLAYQTLTSSDSKYNWTLRSSDANYQGGVDVTNIVRNSINTVPSSTINLSGYSGTFWGANVQAEQMTNGFGAWSLVVIYEDYADTLKNISLYDGYIAVNNGNTIPTTLSGFLTPTSGPVESNFMVFAGEGDITLTDSVTMSNSLGDQSLGDNVFNSSETINGDKVTNRDPSCENTIGIDIDVFDVGTNSALTPIIRNNQTSTIVKLTSSGDVYYPGVFAFSTQLYTPDVCYLEDVTFNGQPITSLNLPSANDNVEYEVSVTNKNNEVAKGVFIEKVFDKPREITYVPGSMKIAPIPGTAYSAKTDTIGDDTAEFATDTNTSKLLLGTGAAWYEGGAIIKDAVTKFKYQAKIGDQNITENTYLVSYRNDLLHITFSGLPIRKCVDFNNSFGTYVPVIGKYNTVRSGAVNIGAGDTDPVLATDPKNALYTQIVNRGINVDVLNFGSDNITPTTPSSAFDLNLSIVELSSDGNCTNDSISAIQTLNYTTSDKSKPATVLPLKASQNAAFKMVTSIASLCSRDRFSIRPASYSMDANETKMIGGKNYNFTFTATQDGLTSPSIRYDQNMTGATDKNGTTQLVIPTGCLIVNVGPKLFNDPASYNLPFSDGQVIGIVSYPEIGDVNFTITDNHWTKASDDQTKGDCVVGSASNIVDANGKVGCMVQGAKVFTFLPDRFNSLVSLANGSSNGSFTYLSNEQNMSAPLVLNTTALLSGGATATNYTAKCFARDINTTISLMNNQALTWSNSQNRINFFDDLNRTSQLLNQVGSVATFRSSEGNFTNGTAPITFRFNFDRNQTIPDNSFIIARNDFNITAIRDENLTTGNDFNRTLDMNATFVYGRIVPRDIRVFGAVPYSANAWYEVFNIPMIGGTTLSPSRNEAMWYTNTLHTDNVDGNGTVSQISSGNLPNNTTYAAGVKNYNFNASATIPYSAKAHIDTDPWLWYGANVSPYLDPSAGNLDCLTHPCFNVNVVPAVGATGSAKYQDGTTTEMDKSSKASTSGGGAWRSTSDYAPATR